MSLRRGLDFVVNGERHHHDEPVKVGELQVWDVVNATQMDHPFHLHGFFFQVIAINGKKPCSTSFGSQTKSLIMNNSTFDKGLSGNN